MVSRPSAMTTETTMNRRTTVKAHAYRWATTVTMLVITVEALGAGRKW
jgi:hypothetical protein